MKDKIVKGRKDYVCDCCNELIKKGEYSLVGKLRAPNYDEGDNQIGIEYLSWRLHDDPNTCESNIKEKESIN